MSSFCGRYAGGVESSALISSIVEWSLVLCEMASSLRTGVRLFGKTKGKAILRRLPHFSHFIATRPEAASLALNNKRLHLLHRTSVIFS